MKTPAELAESLIRRSIRSGEVVSAPYSVELDRELWECGTTDDSTPDDELRYVGELHGDEWAVELVRSHASLTPNAPRSTLSPSDIVRVSGLMAGAYKGSRSNLSALLTHAWVDGKEKSLCGKISIASMSDLTDDRAPTCETCARRLGAHPITDDFPDMAERRARDLTPNASQLEWVKGSGIDRDGHNLTWWKNKAAKWSGSRHDRPTVFIQVLCWDRAGASTRDWPQFDPGELKEAKAYAKEFIERTGGSCRVDGRIEIPYQGTVTIELGEWKNTASNGYYVWSVDRNTFMPVSRKGPFGDYDEALTIAKNAARGGSTYDEVISFGGDPDAGDFEISKAFKGWSGEVHYTTDLPKVGGRLREYRRK